MPVIYEPKGMALEYAELAANLYRGCSHACRFCYAPSVLRKSGTTLDSFRHDVQPRRDIIRQFGRDCCKLAEAGCKKRVLLSFTTDPYQPAEREHRITRQALQMLNEYGLTWQVCTKNGLQAMEDDLALFTEGGGWLGQTIVFMNDTDRELWEPGASPIEDRLRALEIAHNAGIRTWVSVEPVIDRDQALALIDYAAPHVDTWKIGKLNHLHLLEPGLRARVEHIDWQAFVDGLIAALHSQPRIAYLIKDSLLPYWPADVPSSTLRTEPVQRSRTGGAPQPSRCALTLS
ncbi:MAG: radical SAM protein [Armatimonadia bacterium]